MEAGTKIPRNWIWSQLSQFCELINGDRGRNYPSRDKLSAEGIPFVNAGHIQGNSVTDVGMNFIDEERFQLLNSGKFTVGDILLCIRGSLGKVALNTHLERGAIASSLIIVRPHKQLDVRYVLYYLAGPLAAKMIRKYDNGTAQPNLSGADLARFEVPVPPYREQLRIVERIEELLSELDAGIENLKLAREQLKVYRQAVLKHAFEGKLTAQWREKNNDKLESKDQLFARIKQEREASYQRQLTDWKEGVKAWEAGGQKGKKPAKPRALKPVTQLQAGILKTLPDAPHCWAWSKLGWMTSGVGYGTAAKSSDSGTVPVIRMGNIQNAMIDWDDLVFTSDAAEIEKYTLTAGDVLFNRTNSPEWVGKTALYRGERPAVFAGYLIRVNQISSIVDSQYLNLFLNSHIARQHGNTVKTDGVNQSNINGEKLQGYPFPYCSLAEQREVVRLLDEKLSLADRMISDIEADLASADALHQSILKKAFSGSLVAQDPSDEPASVLLERIKRERAEQGNGMNNSKRRDAA